MMGAPEVVSLNALLIKSLGGRKVLDVGVYTGASSLAMMLVTLAVWSLHIAQLHTIPPPPSCSKQKFQRIVQTREPQWVSCWS